MRSHLDLSFGLKRHLDLRSPAGSCSVLRLLSHKPHTVREARWTSVGDSSCDWPLRVPRNTSCWRVPAEARLGVTRLVSEARAEPPQVLMYGDFKASVSPHVRNRHEACVFCALSPQRLEGGCGYVGCGYVGYARQQKEH